MTGAAPWSAAQLSSRSNLQHLTKTHTKPFLYINPSGAFISIIVFPLRCNIVKSHVFMDSILPCSPELASTGSRGWGFVLSLGLNLQPHHQLPLNPTQWTSKGSRGRAYKSEMSHRSCRIQPGRFSMSRHGALSKPIACRLESLDVG